MQQGSVATAPLTDEQILGIEPDGDATDSDSGRHTPPAAAGSPEEIAAEETAAPAAAHDGTQQSAEQDDAQAGPAATEPAWLKSLDAQPEAAAEARRWRDAARDMTSLDAAYFSAQPEARAGLAARLYENDPAAFRAMLAEGARVLSGRDPQALAELARQLGAPEPEATAPATRTISQAARSGDGTNDAPGDTFQGTPAAFPADAYRSFEVATNREFAERMHDAIGRTLGATLPEGIADGARRRIAEDVFSEIHATLSGDRELSRQVGDALRSWRFDAPTQQQVVGLLAGRARAVLPDVARRVVAEWTSSVLAADRARAARIDAAASRRDITGGRLPEPVPPSALHPRDIDYGRLSDEQILNL